MYFKAKDLTLVLIFNTLEHFRCFSGYRGAGTPGDDRRDRASADAQAHGRAAARGGLCTVFRRPHGGRLPAISGRYAVVCRIYASQGGSDHGSLGGYGSRWYDCVRTTYHQKTDRTSYFQNISVPHRRRFSLPTGENRNAAIFMPSCYAVEQEKALQQAAFGARF